MITLEVERALERWISTVGDPEVGQLSYRTGSTRNIVPVRRGADDRPRKVPVIICTALDDTWEQDYPAPNFRGIASVEFLYGCDPRLEAPMPADEGLRLAQVIDQALHRPDLLEELNLASNGTLYFSGFTAGLQHSSATEARHWSHTWALPLYVCHLVNQSSQCLPT